jgi:hypothetical protein
MKFTKERKIYLGLLAAGLTALGVDHSLSSSEASETPNVSTSLIVDKPELPRQAAPSIPAIPDGSSISNPLVLRLRAVEKSEQLTQMPIHDAFTLPNRWAADCRTGPTEPKPLTPAEEFEKSHQLNAVMLAGRRSKAIVDGQSISIGQLVDGFKLTEVTERSAVLKSSAGQVVLRLKLHPQIAGTTP